MNTDGEDFCFDAKSEDFCLELSALRPGGIWLSEAAQGAASRLLRRLFVQATKRRMRLSSTHAEDIIAFAMDGMCQGADTYGEILPQGVMDMLWIVGARPGDRFYDLGAGCGKVVMQAWMSGLRATGVELSRVRWEASGKAISLLKGFSASGGFIFSGKGSAQELPTRVADGLDYLCENAFNLDFTDADVIFVSSVMFSEQMMATLAATARWMKPGSLIVSYLSFPGPEFEEIGVFTGPTSWSGHTTWVVQKVLSNPTHERRPSGLRRSHEFDESCRWSFWEEAQQENGPCMLPQHRNR